jgi:hypothetical protein
MAPVAAAGGGLLMLVVGVIFLTTDGDVLFGAALLLFPVGALLCFYFPGNLIAMYPYAVTVEDGRGVWIHAAFRKTYVPSGDLRDVQPGAVGTCVRLKRRRRLLGSFYVHWAFGPEAAPLADAIRNEIRNQQGSPEARSNNKRT